MFWLVDSSIKHYFLWFIMPVELSFSSLQKELLEIFL